MPPDTPEPPTPPPLPDPPADPNPDADTISAAWVASLDQHKATLRTIADLAAHYWAALMVSGLPYPVISELLLNWHEAMLGVVLGTTED